MLHFRWKNVNQFQSRVFGLVLPRIKDNALCPVQAIFNCPNLSQGADLESPVIFTPA